MEKLPKKEKRKIGYRIFMMAVAAVALVAATIAWFASSNSVDASGMVTKAEEEPNLVIATSIKDLEEMPRGNMVFSVTLTDSGMSTKPVTHSDTGIDSSSKIVDLNTYPCLKILSDPNAVDKTTGKPEDDSPAFTDITNGDTRYYRDCRVYIAAFPSTLESHQIKATLSGTISQDEHRAFSVDIYRRSKADTNYYYAGTLNLKDSSILSGITSIFGANSVVVYDGDVPGNQDGYIEVLFRCYFDGALGPDDNSTYINSDTLTEDDMSASITFRATESGS